VDSPYLQQFVFVGLAIFLVLIFLLIRHLNAKRRDAFAEVAAQSGWSFAPETEPVESLDLLAFPLTVRGRSQRVSNVARGSQGSIGFIVFDHKYTTGAGKHQHTTTQTVVHARSPRLSLPPFELGPENVFHKIGQKLGYHDIDFESSPEFSSKYLLRAKEHEEEVRALFTPPVLNYFEQHPNLSVEGMGDEMLIYRNARQTKIDDLRMFVEDALATARQFER
jgi:hypothetical protein